MADVSPSGRFGHRVALQRFERVMYKRPWTRLAGLLAGPLAWIGGIYLGALIVLLTSAFWSLNPLTSAVVHSWSLSNFSLIVRSNTYKSIAYRTAGIAAAVTVVDIVLALPISYYAARIASRRTRSALLLLVVLPLWSSYLVRTYSWRLILDDHGLLNWMFQKAGAGSLRLGFSQWGLLIVFAYLWLPFVILPIYTAFERIPDSVLEASADLGASETETIRRVLLPLAVPGIAAGSIFAFSLTLGDYIVPQLVGKTQFIGTVVYQNVGVANNVPFAAAYAVVPIVVMAAYLLITRRLGAFEAL